MTPIKFKIQLIIILTFSLLYLKSNAHSDKEIQEKTPIKVLLIGSSHFGYNNMPEKIRKLASKSQKDIIIEEFIIYGWTLSMHAENPDTYTKIKSSKWDYVFLQGANYFLAKTEWHHLIKPYVIELKKAIIQNSSNTKIFYMMPWAYEYGLVGIEGYTDTWEEMSEDLYHESTKFAKEIDISITPAGWAWYKARKEQQNIDLYMDDQGHPNNTGSYLLACVIYSSLFIESCEDNPYLDVLNAEKAKFLQKIASETVLNNLAKWNISETTDIINTDLDNSELSFYNSPNPFKDHTNINFSLDKRSSVVLTILNSKGEVVKNIQVGNLPSGLHYYSLPINQLNTGIYLCSICTNHYSKSVKMIKL